MIRSAASFWQMPDELPEGSGYALFSAEHILILIGIAAAATVSLVLYSRQTANRQDRARKITAAFLPVLEAAKLIFLLIRGVSLRWYLPLHFCSISIYLYPVIAFSRKKERRAALGEMADVLMLPAAVAALLFPDWTSCPFWNFMSLHSYMWHFLQMLFPLMLLVDGTVRPSVRHAWKSILFTAVVFVPVYVINCILKTNYFFVMQPVPDTPLEFLAETFGMKLYIPALYGLVILCILMMYLVFFAAGKIRKAAAGQEETNER